MGCFHRKTEHNHEGALGVQQDPRGEIIMYSCIVFCLLKYAYCNRHEIKNEKRCKENETLRRARQIWEMEKIHLKI
mgnify:CR=1 FL=1